MELLACESSFINGMGRERGLLWSDSPLSLITIYASLL
jgi:hypothetical protein